MEKTIIILDGQGGGLGKSVAERLLQENLRAKLIAVGANAIATSNMMRAGITTGATGENACLYNCRQADIIIGPIGIMITNSMHGEISPAIAQAVAQSDAVKILIPFANAHIKIVGLEARPLGQHLEEMVKAVRVAIEEE